MLCLVGARDRVLFFMMETLTVGMRIVSEAEESYMDATNNIPSGN